MNLKATIIFLVSIFVSIQAMAQMMGPSTRAVGAVGLYSYQGSPGQFFNPVWTTTNGTIVVQSLSSDGSTATASVQWNVAGTWTLQLSDGGMTYATKSVTVTSGCGTINQPTFAAQSVCSGVTKGLVATPASGCVVRWYATASGGSHLFEGNTYPVTITTSTTYYVTSYNTSTTCQSTRKAMTVSINPSPSMATVGGPYTICSGSTISISASPGSNGNAINWLPAPTDGTSLASGNTYTTPVIPKTTTYYAQSINTTTGCKADVFAPVEIQVLGTPTAIADQVIYEQGTITLTAVPPVSTTAKWYTTPTGGSAFFSGNVYTTPLLTASTKYYVSTASSANACETTSRIPIAVTVQKAISPIAITTETVRIPGIVSGSDIDALTSTQKYQQVSYLDGLARTRQSIAVKASPLGKDVVQVMDYNALGQSPKAYLPYIASTTNGALQATPLTDQANFYTINGDKIENDAAPYATAVFEASPLGRVLEKGSVGTAFQPGTGHTIRAQYSYNTTADNVRKFNTDGTSSSFYAANTLSKVQVTDANGNHSITFTDAFGRTILTLVQLDEVINGVTTAYLKTYTIYDDLGRVKFTISPKGVATLEGNSWSFSQSVKDQFVYQYVYDDAGRVVEKKVPGQGWQYFVYDKLGRMVLSQDALLRGTNKWAFVKYDHLNRPIMQGLYFNASQTARSAIQNLVNGLYKASNATYPANAYYESRGTTLHGYTNVSFPKINANSTALEILGVSYYESYDFDYNGSRDFKYDSITFSGQANSSFWRATGMPTGSKRLVLGTSNWLYTYVFYDKKRRPVQMLTNNHLNSTINNLTTIIYDFEGKVLSTKKYHHAGSSNITTVINNYEYDPAGRLIRVYQNNNNTVNQLVAQYEYNELGQLVDKKLHNTSGSTFLQSVDYRYTINGMLASINNAKLNIDAANNDDTNDYFGLELLYHTVDSGLGNTADFNGNASAVKWKDVGTAAGTAGQKSYRFAYDKAGKLETATSQVHSGSTWSKEVSALNESMTYDHNGNILTLQRSQRKHQLSGTTVSYTTEMMDNLTYTYNSALNDQLQKVTDATALGAGFNNGSSGTSNDYAYDVNGNLTSDLNKGISSMVYNELGKVKQVNFSDGRKVDYVYDAGGNKLTVKTWQGATLLTTTDYVDGFVYENGTLNFFGSPEGRVVKKGSTLEYQYAIADHQGNTRVVFSSATQTPVAVIATFEGNAGDNASQFNLNNVPVVSNASANHTTSGSGVIRMNQNYKIGPSKSVKVFPGDKIDLEVWEYHEGSSGFGTSSTPATALIAAVATAFGGVSGGAGESGMIYSGVSSAVGAFGSGGNQGDSRPAAYLNYILFNKDFKVLDAGWQLAPAATFTKQKLSFPTKTIQEAGYIYVWLSYDDDSNNWVYFDDFKVTHTPSAVIQSNEYYPFGLQTSNSWTRENTTGNNFLYNQGSELNTNTGWYDTPYRGYDATLGRFMQVDPLASSQVMFNAYHYAYNNPVGFNDPMGLDPRNKPLPTEYESNSGSGSGGGGWAFLPYGRGNNNWSNQYASSHYMSAETFISMAMGSMYGGTWNSGQASFFNSDQEAFAAGAAYNFEHDSWGNTYYGSYESTYVGYVALQTIGELLSPESVNTAINIHRQLQDSKSEFSEFVKLHFGDELKRLNSTENIRWRIFDINSDLAHSSGRTGMRPDGTVLINISARAMLDPKLLYLTVGHELVHAADLLNGNYEKWRNALGNGYEWYGTENIMSMIMEHHAYSWDAAAEAAMGVNYGAAAELEYLNSQLNGLSLQWILDK